MSVQSVPTMGTMRHKAYEHKNGIGDPIGSNWLCVASARIPDCDCNKKNIDWLID